MGAYLTKNKCAEVHLVKIFVINLAINFLAKLWKEMIECGGRFINHIKVKSHKVVVKVLQKM